MNVNENNSVVICGEICSGFEFIHEVYGEKFYIAKIKINRESGYEDIIRFMVSDRMIKIDDLSGVRVSISGEYRSHNRWENGKSHLELVVFVKDINEVDFEFSDLNKVELVGYICKEPTYRTTHFGREITDFLLVVNRPYCKSDYIPCICWGRNARFVSDLEVGTHLKINGRIQSREYSKKFDDGTEEVRTAYEVSVGMIDVVGESEDNG